MRPLLADLPLPYLRALPPDLLRPALESLPVIRCLGSECAALAHLWDEDALPPPSTPFAKWCDGRLHALSRDPLPRLADVLAREGPTACALLTAPAPRRRAWQLCAAALANAPLALGAALLYEDYAERTRLGAPQTYPTSALALLEKTARAPSKVDILVNGAEIIMDAERSRVFSAVQCMFTALLDAILAHAVAAKDVTLARVGTAPTTRTLLLHDRRADRIFEAVHTHSAMQHRIVLHETPLWDEWLRPALARTLAVHGIVVNAAARDATESFLPQVCLPPLKAARTRGRPAADERSCVPWPPDAPPQLERDVALLLCDLSAGEVAEPPIAPDCPRLLAALLPYLLPRHPHARYEDVHAAVHAVAGVAPPADLGPAGGAVPQCAAAHAALPPEARSPLADTELAAWTLFYAPDAPTTKGSGGDLLIIDEAAYVDKDLFYETILPLLGMKDAALIAISTPLSELNWFSALLSAKDEDGEFFFKIVRLATVCKKCQKLPSEEAILCDHQKDINPPWKSGPRQDRLKALADLDSADRFARENAGLVVGGEDTVFPRELVKALLADDATTPWFRAEDAGVAVGEGYRPDCLYTVADPNAGGASALAVMTGFIVHSHPTIKSGTLVVVAIDERRCRDHLEQNDLICEHIRHVRERPGYDEAVPLVFVPENMTGFNHTTMESAIVGMPNVHTYYQNGGAIPGVRKGPYESRAYTRITLELMYRHEIMFDRHWLSPTAARHREGERMGRRKMWEELRAQLMRYGYDEKGKLTGKYDGLFRDDLCIAFMMLAYWSQAIEKPGAANPAAGLQFAPPGSTPATERARYLAMQPRTTGVPTHFPAGYRAGQPLQPSTRPSSMVHRVQY